MSSEVIRISTSSASSLSEIQAEYVKRFGVSIQLREVADIVITHGKDAARKKLNLAPAKKTK